MNNKVVLSIVIPIYNSEKYLRQCLDSIINQSYKDYELILVDDGSEDNSRLICREYCKYDNVKLVENKHEGLFRTRKIGVEESKGEYITFVDSDDFVSENSYSMAEQGMKNGIDAILFDIYRYYYQQEIVYDSCHLEDRIYNKDDIEKTIYPNMIWDNNSNRFGVDPSLCSKIIKASLIKQVYNSIEDIHFEYGEDSVITFPMLVKAESIQIIHKAYYYHRQRLGGQLANYIADSEFIDNTYSLYKLLSKEMDSNSIFQKQIDLFYVYSVALVKRQYGLGDPPCDSIFPFDRVPKGKKIIIYGAGAVGKLYYRQVRSIDYCEVVLWADRKYKELGEEVSSPELISQVEYDYVVIAIDSKFTSKQIYEYLINCGVSPKQIISNK